MTKGPETPRQNHKAKYFNGRSIFDYLQKSTNLQEQELCGTLKMKEEKANQESWDGHRE